MQIRLVNKSDIKIHLSCEDSIVYTIVDFEYLVELKCPLIYDLSCILYWIQVDRVAKTEGIYLCTALIVIMNTPDLYNLANISSLIGYH